MIFFFYMIFCCYIVHAEIYQNKNYFRSFIFIYIYNSFVYLAPSTKKTMQILISMDEGSLSSIYKKENPSPVKKQLFSLERKEY